MVFQADTFARAYGERRVDVLGHVKCLSPCQSTISQELVPACFDVGWVSSLAKLG